MDGISVSTLLYKASSTCMTAIAPCRLPLAAPASTYTKHAVQIYICPVHQESKGVLPAS